MKTTFVALISLALFFTACRESEKVDTTDPLESGRGFIEESLKGNYVQAKKYLLEDSTNLQYFNGLRDFNTRLSKGERQNYSEANIIIDSTNQVSDSVFIISYSNTYKKVPSKLKVVKHDNEWLVDFKYTFIENPIMIDQ